MDMRDHHYTIEFTEADKHSEPAIVRLIEDGHYVAKRNVADVDCLWVRLKTKVNSRLLEQYTCLKYVVTPTTGTDHIDMKACQERGVTVLSLAGERSFLDGIPATAEHTLGLMLWCLRGWKHGGDFKRPRDAGEELCGKRVGIIGMGRIGSQVARLVSAFGASVQETHKDADIVSVHLPLERSTHRFCSDVMFNEMRSGGYFVNTSRGNVVEEEALLFALKIGSVKRAALDVIFNDSPFGSVAWSYSQENPDRLLVTPHIGGYTRESLEKCELFMAEKLLNHIGTNGNDKSLRTGMCAGIPGTVA